MIVVDIGNSGLRAARVSDALGEANRFPEDLDVFKLSWSVIGQQIRKARPQTIDSSQERWSTLGDIDALRWLIRSVADGEKTAWRIASVHRDVQSQLADALTREAPDVEVQWVTYRDLPMKICVEHPERVGIDRLLAARAARHLLRLQSAPEGPSVVVQAGTALTVDWVDEQERFQGGAILPGVGLSLQYMAAGTDQLPWLPSDRVHQVPPLPGKNTEQAIAAGVHAAVVGGAKYLIDRYRDGQGVPVVISGGDGQLLRDAIQPPVVFQKHLVLMGLALPMVR
ncbi:MAG: type III pantothenate kinase [Planctomycetota bacterium]|jgi:type III pantothenate kinase